MVAAISCQVVVDVVKTTSSPKNIYFFCYISCNCSLYFIHSYGLFASVSTILKTNMGKYLKDIVKFMIDSLQSTEGIVVSIVALELSHFLRLKFSAFQATCFLLFWFSPFLMIFPSHLQTTINDALLGSLERDTVPIVCGQSAGFLCRSVVAQEYCVGVGREFDVSPCRHSGSSNNSEMKALTFAVTSVVIPTCLDSLVVSYKEDRPQPASSKNFVEPGTLKISHLFISLPLWCYHVKWLVLERHINHFLRLLQNV